MREEALGFLFVPCGDLQFRRLPGTPPEQLDMKFADPAADLQDRCVCNAMSVEEVDDPSTGRVQPVLAIAPGHLSRKAVTKHFVALVAVTATTHPRSMTPHACYGQSRSRVNQGPTSPYPRSVGAAIGCTLAWPLSGTSARGISVRAPPDPAG